MKKEAAEFLRVFSQVKDEDLDFAVEAVRNYKFLKLENEKLKSNLEKAKNHILLELKNQDGCNCQAEESDGGSLICYLHEALKEIGDLK